MFNIVEKKKKERNHKKCPKEAVKTLINGKEELIKLYILDRESSVLRKSMNVSIHSLCKGFLHHNFITSCYI